MASRTRTGVRAALVALGALGAIVGARVVASSDERATKPPPPARAEAEPVDAPPEAGGDPGAVPATIPAVTAPAHGITCARGWSFFDNPVMHVGVCVPPGWGFSDLERPERLDAVRRETLQNLRLLSAGAFPWRPGELPFDAIVARGVLDLEMNLLEPGVAASTECEPNAARRAGGRTLLVCEQAYDALGLPAPTGPIRAIKAIVPLLRAPVSLEPGFPLQGARLLVIARHAATASPEEVDLLWRVIDGIRAW